MLSSSRLVIVTDGSITLAARPDTSFIELLGGKLLCSSRFNKSEAWRRAIRKVCVNFARRHVDGKALLGTSIFLRKK